MQNNANYEAERKKEYWKTVAYAKIAENQRLREEITRLRAKIISCE